MLLLLMLAIPEHLRLNKNWTVLTSVGDDAVVADDDAVTAIAVAVVVAAFVGAKVLAKNECRCCFCSYCC